MTDRDDNQTQLEGQSLRGADKDTSTTTRRWSADATLKLLQSVAIVVGAAWALFQYVKFQRAANDYQLAQAQVATEQAKLQLATQQAQRGLRDVELRNSVELQKLSQAQQALNLEQSKFGLERQRVEAGLKSVELQNSVALQQLNLELSRMRREREGLDLQYRKETRYACSAKLTVARAQDDLYKINYSADCVNTSDANFDASVVIIDYFIGRFDRTLIDKQEFGQVEQPPGRWANLTVSPSAVRWRRVGSWGGVASSLSSACVQFSRIVAPDLRFTTAAPGTGTWKPKETMRIDRDFVIKASEDDYVSVVSSIVFNQACNMSDDSYDRFSYFEVKALRKNIE